MLRWFAGWLLLSVALSATAAENIMHRYFVSSDGVRLHYLEAGAGDRTLLLIPGWLMPAAIFEAQLTALAQDYRVLALDPRSQGLSAVTPGSHSPERRTRDIAEWLEAAAVGDFVLGGWSLGVLEALDYVERFRPRRLRGLILIDNSIGEGQPPRQASKGTYHQIADPKRRQAFIDGFCQGLYRQPPPPALAEAVRKSAYRMAGDVALQVLRQPYPRTYWRDIVLQQSVPMLYAVTPRLREQAEILQTKKPQQAEVVVFDTAGHALFVDAAEAFNQRTSQFLQRAFAADHP